MKSISSYASGFFFFLNEFTPHLVFRFDYMYVQYVVCFLTVEHSKSRKQDRTFSVEHRVMNRGCQYLSICTVQVR